MDDVKLFWLNRHPCSEGLEPLAVRELAEQMELVSVETDQEVHAANQAVTSILFITKGRLKQTFLDLQGRMVEQTYLGGGSQVGILAAAQQTPVPIQVVAHEPTTFLRLEFSKAMSFASKHPEFQINLFRLAGNQVRRFLAVDTIRNQPEVVAVVHQTAGTRSLTPRLLLRLAEVEKNPCVFSDDPDWNPMPGFPHRSLLDGDQVLEPESIRNQVSDWAGLGRLFFDIRSSHELGVTAPLLGAADLVLWCVEPETWSQAVAPLKSLQEKVPGWRDKINLVWVLKGDRCFPPLAAEIRQLVDRDFKVSFEEPSGNRGTQLRNGLERIIHQLRGVRIGLALGGGAARGMAKLGVLKALEQSGIVVDMIAGTSAGAMTGTIYASGLDPDYSIERFVQDLRPSWFFRQIPRGEHWHLFYKYRRGQFNPMLRKYLADACFEQLPLPMNTVTVDLVGGGPVVRDRGDAVEGILESINLPGLATPICRSGQALVDGGLVNNVPADVLVNKGCNFVIAVSVTAELEKEFASIRADSTTIKQRTPSTIQTLLRGYLVQHVNMNSIGVQPADFVIEPDVISFGLTEFTRTDELAARGEEAAQRVICDILSSLSRLDGGLFPAK